MLAKRRAERVLALTEAAASEAESASVLVQRCVATRTPPVTPATFTAPRVSLFRHRAEHSRRTPRPPREEVGGLGEVGAGRDGEVRGDCRHAARHAGVLLPPGG